MLEDFDFSKFFHFHFIGIGGSGMAGLAEILYKKKFKVTGSDIKKNDNTSRLYNMGIPIYYGHNQCIKADVYIISNAIPINNSEVIYAKNENIQLVVRSKLLSSIAKTYKNFIGVMGTHGKTTTVGMIGTLFKFLQYDPTIYAGATMQKSEYDFIGSSEYFIAELDESNKGFLDYMPKNIVLTNLEMDHLENYSNDFNVLQETLIVFLNKIPSNGILVACSDCKNIMQLLNKIKCKVVTYGFNNNADYVIKDISYKVNETSYIIQKNNILKNAKINIPGAHNALNSLASIVMADCLGIDIDNSINGIIKFQGMTRRLEESSSFNYRGKNITVFDDYGHHPTEINATLQSLRNLWPNRDIFLLFQPHRYSRTKLLYSDFIKSFQQFDRIYLFDIFSAGEANDYGISSEIIVNDVKKYNDTYALYVKLDDNIEDMLLKDIKNDTIILIQGAGNIADFAANMFQNM